MADGDEIRPGAIATRPAAAGEPVRLSPGVPGELLLHPLALASLVVLLVNDHWAKERFASDATGKLSDVAGIFLFPLLLVSVAEALRWMWGTDPEPGRRRRETFGAAVFTALAFSAIKTVTLAGWLYTTSVGAVRWVPSVVRSLMGSHGVPPFPDVQLIRDPTDLLALPILILSCGAAAAPIRFGAPWPSCGVRNQSARRCDQRP